MPAAIKDMRLGIRLSERRFNKLRKYADAKEKTVTAVIEDWIDSLKIPVVEKDS